MAGRRGFTRSPDPRFSSLNNAIPQTADKLVAQYRIDSAFRERSPHPWSADRAAHLVSTGCGAVGAVSKSGAYQIEPSDNGYLIIQTASSNFTLPVTPPSAGWCVALLYPNTGSITLGNSGNTINGARPPVSRSTSSARPLRSLRRDRLLGFGRSGSRGVHGHDKRCKYYEWHAAECANHVALLNANLRQCFAGLLNGQTGYALGASSNVNHRGGTRRCD